MLRKNVPDARAALEKATALGVVFLRTAITMVVCLLGAHSNVSAVRVCSNVSVYAFDDHGLYATPLKTMSCR